MMQCMVVDDEPLIRELIEDNISRLPFLTLASSCKGSREAMAVLREKSVDLIFLDIQMPFINGLQFLQSLDQPPLIIIITAYEKYALKGFELNVVDYLLKPFSLERFVKACNRAYDLFLLKGKLPAAYAGPGHFFVHVEYQIVKINIADIEYIQGLKDYIRIFLQKTSRPVLTRMSMKAVEEKVPAGMLVRTHKSFLVAAAKITRTRKNFIELGGTQVPLSAHYREEVLRRLQR